MDLTTVITELEGKRERLDNAIRGLRELSETQPPITTIPLTRETKPITRETKAPIPAPKQPKPETPKPEADGRRSPIQDACISVIRKFGPLTSADVFERVRSAGIPTTSGSVYQTLRVLRDEKRLVESRAAEDDGRTKWHLVEAAKAVGA